MKFAAYSHYKPSPISWLDQMPKHWDAASLRWMSRRYSGGTPDKGNEAYWEDGAIPWINSGAVNDGYVVEPSALITREAFANSSAKWIPKDALVMALAGQGKTKGMVAQLGIKTTCNQSMAAIIPDHRFAPRYLYWWLIANYQNIRNMAGGEARDGLNLDMLGSIPCPVPPVPEQQTIARFLDAQTSRIDTLVAKKRQLIAKLKEKRNAMIARTVTRGLPPEAAKAAGLEPNPEMKYSGVDWLGDIPTHWNVKRIKEVSQLVGRIGYRGYTTEDLVPEAEGAISMSPSNMADGVVGLSKCTWLSWDKYYESPEIIVEPGDVIMVKTGSTFGKTAVVGSVPIPMTINPQLMIFKSVTCSKKFLFYYLYSKVIQDLIPLQNTGSTIPTMTQESIGRLYFPQPLIPEQLAITAYLDEESAKLDALSEKVEQVIARLTEYRQALITSAVTGKIDVREAAG